MSGVVVVIATGLFMKWYFVVSSPLESLLSSLVDSRFPSIGKCTFVLKKLSILHIFLCTKQGSSLFPFSCSIIVWSSGANRKLLDIRRQGAKVKYYYVLPVYFSFFLLLCFFKNCNSVGTDSFYSLITVALCLSIVFCG